MSKAKLAEARERLARARAGKLPAPTVPKAVKRKGPNTFAKRKQGAKNRKGAAIGSRAMDAHSGLFKAGRVYRAKYKDIRGLARRWAKRLRKRKAWREAEMQARAMGNATSAWRTKRREAYALAGLELEHLITETSRKPRRHLKPRHTLDPSVLDVLEGIEHEGLFDVCQAFSDQGTGIETRHNYTDQRELTNPSVIWGSAATKGWQRHRLGYQWRKARYWLPHGMSYEL